MAGVSVVGHWRLRIATPIGAQTVTLELWEGADGSIAGVARGEAETTPLLNPQVDGNRLTWGQAITRPMRLNLLFDVTIEGDTLMGVSRAGLLPASKVSGTRVAVGA